MVLPHLLPTGRWVCYYYTKTAYKKGWEYSFEWTSFKKIISSFCFHYLLSSTDSMWMIWDYQSLSYVLLSLYSFSSTLPSKFTLAMLETFRKNHRPLAEVSWQGTAPYYVRTFRLQLTNTFALLFKFAPYSKVSLVRSWFQVVVRQPASLPFEQQNTELLDVLSLTPYFKFAS